MEKLISHSFNSHSSRIAYTQLQVHFLTITIPTMRPLAVSYASINLPAFTHMALEDLNKLMCDSGWTQTVSTSGFPKWVSPDGVYKVVKPIRKRHWLLTFVTGRREAKFGCVLSMFVPTMFILHDIAYMHLRNVRKALMDTPHIWHYRDTGRILYTDVGQ